MTDSNGQTSGADKLKTYRAASAYLEEHISYKDHPGEAHAIRMLLIDEPLQGDALRQYWREEFFDNEYLDEDEVISLETAEKIVKAILELKNAPFNLGRDDLTELAMSLSLCPIHFVDWAICFDDQPQDCEQVRQIFPTRHDT